MQTNEYMTFKGISFNCDINIFASNLEQVGYTQVLMQEGAAIFSGNFAGKDDCTIIVLATNKSQLVWKVIVNFPEQISWRSLKNEYDSFKDLYTKKYGNPNAYEFFDYPYEEGDGHELTALELEKCTYSSYFTTNQGVVVLKIDSQKNIKVEYEDKINCDIWEAEKEQSILSEI